MRGEKGTMGRMAILSMAAALGVTACRGGSTSEHGSESNTSVQQRHKWASSQLLESAPDEITISNESLNGDEERWTAAVQGVRFNCSLVGVVGQPATMKCAQDYERK